MAVLRVKDKDGNIIEIPSIKGDKGDGFTILGYYQTAAELSSVISPAAGDVYGVGTEYPYDFYIWDGVNSVWVNNGQLQGVKGEKGETGPAGKDGKPGKDGYSPVKGTDYWTEADKAEVKGYVDEALEPYGEHAQTANIHTVISTGTTDLTAGTSAMAENSIYLMYK